MSVPALAQDAPLCPPRDHVVGALKDGHGETPVFRGVTADRKMFEIFANMQAGTWTAIVTNKRGEGCPVAAGENLRLIKAPEGPEA